MPEVDQADVLLVCAGSNDLLARRSLAEWEEGLEAVLDDAASRARHVVVCSAGQLYRSPSLMPVLRSVLLERTAAQTAISVRLCAERGVPYIDFSEMVPNEGFWAEDGFHPSAWLHRKLAKRLDTLIAEPKRPTDTHLLTEAS